MSLMCKRHSFRRSAWLRACGIGLGLVLLGSCEPAAETTTVAYTDPYFSLEDYFEAEIAELTQRQQRVQKKVVLNGETEEQILDQVDFRNELQLFLDADINRPAWSDKYQIDSLYQAGKLHQIAYTTSDSTLATRAITVTFATTAVPRVEAVEIHAKMETVLSDSDKWLRYEPQRAYTIRTTHASTMSDSLQLEIVATFVE